MSVYVLFCFLFCLLYNTVLCIVIPLPPGTYPLAINNNNNNSNNNNNNNKIFRVGGFVGVRKRLALMRR
jgi:hypothetical protein